MLSGTLSVPNLSLAGSAGPLGKSTLPVVLGGSGTTGTLLYTGNGTNSNQTFTMTAGGGAFAVNTSLGLSGVINGSGGLTKTGTGTLTLSASNLYGGGTTINAGILEVAGTFALPDITALPRYGQQRGNAGVKRRRIIRLDGSRRWQSAHRQQRRLFLRFSPRDRHLGK